MKKLFLLNFLFFILHSYCLSQKEKTSNEPNHTIDSLINVLNAANQDTTKLKTLNNLFLQYEFEDDEKADEYLNKALSLAQKIDYKKGLAAAYSYRGFFFTDKGNYPDALKNHFASLKLYEVMGEKKGVASSYNNIGSVYYYQCNYPEALKNYFKGLSIYKSIDNKKGIVASYNNIGNVFSSQGNYPEALKNLFASLKIKETMGDKRGIASSYNNIGIIYYNQGNYQEALKNHRASLKIKEEIGDKNGIADSYKNIGNIYYKQGNNPEALKNHLASLHISESLGNKNGIAASLSNAGNVYSDQGNNQEALKNYLASLKIREEIGDKAGVANSCINIGDEFREQKKYKEAYEYLLKAKESAKEIGHKEYLRDTYKSLTLLDSARGNFKGAYENHKLFSLLCDSLDNEETRKKTIQTQMTYDFEKKEAVTNAEHKKELEKQQALAEEKSHKQRIVISFVVFGLLLVLVFAVLIFRSLRITKKQKQIIEVQKEKVEVQNEEITKQKHLVEEKNHEITSSISYAKRIQRSFLTAPSLIKRHLPDHFILFKPRDVVSGDFYWMHQQGDYSYFCVADCTGHGIPGAFMSLIGMGVLNEIVFSKNILDTNEILNELRRIVILAVNPEDATVEGKDGMDLVYFRFHIPTKELQYSAANNSFYICRKGELIEYKPDKMPVGSFGEYERPFTQHTIQLEDGDIIYGITDGYADQFGGPKGKKFKYKQFEELLLSISQEPMEIQKQKLDDAIENWKGELEQVDDVTVIGIRI